MSEEPHNKPPELVPAELEPQFDALLDDEGASAQTDTPITKGEAKLFDKGPTIDEALKREDVKDRRRVFDEKSDTFNLQQRYTRNLFLLTLVWLVFVLAFVLMTGFRGSTPMAFRYGGISLNLTAAECEPCWRFQFVLSDKVLIAFITSTTASVIGIFYIVAKWLFPAPPQDKPTEPKTPA